MADDIQQPVGALAAASGQAAPAEDVFQVDYEQSRQALRNQQARLDQRREQLMAAMEGRKNRLFDPILMRLAQGLLAPTKTGSFGESLGYGAGAMADEQEREFARQAQDARLMYELEQSSAQQKKEEMLQNREEMEYRRQQKIRDLSGNLVDFKTDEKTGAVTYNVNPMIAQQLTKLTGDMKYADKLIADAQMKTEQKVASSIFEEKQIPATNTEPAKILLKFNPQALLNLTKVSTNPIETIAKYTKIIPDLRKSGLVVFEGVSDNGTPFDAIATMIPDPAIKAQAERLAKQYKEGRLDEDKANTLAQQMLSMATSHMDKQAQRELTQAIAGLNVGMRQQSLAIQAELAQQRIDDKRKTEEQKRIAAQQAQKALSDKADDTIKAVEEIRVHPGRASGVWQAYRPSQIVPGTDAYDFGKQLDVIKSKSFLANVQEMRGMGALSNKEGDKITDAIAKLEPRMSKEAFDKSLDEIVRIMERAKQRAQDIAEGRRPTFEEEKPSGSKAPAGSAPRKFTVIRD